jgi:hypothetical protein
MQGTKKNHEQEHKKNQPYSHGGSQGFSPVLSIASGKRREKRRKGYEGTCTLFRRM